MGFTLFSVGRKRQTSSCVDKSIGMVAFSAENYWRGMTSRGHSEAFLKTFRYLRFE